MTHNDIATDRNDHVRELQQNLRIVRRERDGETDVPVDGFFGPLTTEAVRRSQQESGLPVNGIVDRATWDAVALAAQEIVYLHSLPIPVQAFHMGQAPLQVGDTAVGVRILQVMLLDLADRFVNLYVTEPVSGVYTAHTADAVRKLQEYAGLSPNGIVDKPTWDAITILFNQGET